MNRRRLYAAVFFSVVIVAVLGLLVFTEAVNSSQTVTVLRMTTDVQRGAGVRAGDVVAVPLHGDQAQLNFVQPGQVDLRARYALNLRSGDILRPDDLEAAGAEVDVSLTVTDPPPLGPGDSLDVFAAFGPTQLLIGHGMGVQTVSGTSVTISVPTGDEFAWITIAASKTPLHVARATAGQPANGPAADASDAICRLAGAQCRSVGAAGAPVPAVPTATAIP